MRLPVSFLACFLAVVSVSPSQAAEPKPLEFRLTFDKAISEKPFTGRVFVMLSKTSGEPRMGPNWFKPEPMFARDVKDWKPGETLVIGADVLGFPAPLSKLAKGTWKVQAVMDFNRGERDFSNAPGNGYSKTLSQELDPCETGPVALVLDQQVAPRKFAESERVKLVDIPSKLLSDFHKREVRLRAGVLLPKSFGEDATKRYPIVYEIPGFGGTHFMTQGRSSRTDVNGVDMLWVVLDPSCALGHHVFADSANNGPCGRALVEELVPHLEKEFRALGTPGTRLVTGHSSGGWSSLWLQVTYPEVFGGVWSTSPDPVDFRDFQRINIYRPGVNMFVDGEKEARPLARNSSGKPTLFFRGFSDMDRIMGHGGQLNSFDASFSPRGSDGRPKALWDRDSGVVDADVARSWEKYDIRLILEKNWKTLAPKLAGKLHVYTGAEDTFYLEGAVRLLKESQEKLGSDAVIEIVPGKNHGTLIDSEMRKRIAREMAETVQNAKRG